MTELPLLYLNVASPAIDAFYITKAAAARNFAESRGIPLEQIAAIGDGHNDLPFMTQLGLGLVGTPANADQRVKDVVNEMPNGVVLPGREWFGFKEFYDIAMGQGITHIITDKDGVLKEGATTHGPEFYHLIGSKMGQNWRPLVALLTGSSYAQNIGFIKEYGLDRLGDNPGVVADPYIVLAENGQIEVSALDPLVVKNHVGRFDPVALGLLKGAYERTVIDRVGTQVLPEFGFSWSAVYGEQDDKVYAPSLHLEESGIVGDAPKQAMVTINVPRTVGGNKWRETPAADEFRERVLEIMKETADAYEMPYEVL